MSRLTLSPSRVALKRQFLMGIIKVCQPTRLQQAPHYLVKVSAANSAYKDTGCTNFLAEAPFGIMIVRGEFPDLETWVCTLRMRSEGF